MSRHLAEPRNCYAYYHGCTLYSCCCGMCWQPQEWDRDTGPICIPVSLFGVFYCNNRVFVIVCYGLINLSFSLEWVWYMYIVADYHMHGQIKLAS